MPQRVFHPFSLFPIEFAQYSLCGIIVHSISISEATNTQSLLKEVLIYSLKHFKILCKAALLCRVFEKPGTGPFHRENRGL